jgi:hypothetical protein
MGIQEIRTELFVGIMIVRPRMISENNSKEPGCEAGRWMELAQEHFHRQALVLAVLNLGFCYQRISDSNGAFSIKRPLKSGSQEQRRIRLPNVAALLRHSLRPA